jgi:D-sedoheptulose 7-phosphate isomerase
MDDIDHLCQRIPALVPCRDSIEQVTRKLIQCFQNGNKLLLCGNGGSAADCEHISGELIKRFSKPRPLPEELSNRLGADLSQNLHQGLPALSLPSMIGFHTAFANDDDPAYAFAQQVLAFGQAGDVLLAISTSGNSTNLIHAVNTAKELGVIPIALTGQSGGRLASLCELTIQAPASETPRVQELHLPIYHSICTVVEETLFPESN